MSWRFPKFPIKAARLTDALDTDDNFLEFVEEVGGELNEHNWQNKATAATAIPRTGVDRDDIFLWHSIGVDKTTAGLPSATQLINGTAVGSPGTGTIYVPNANAWTPLPTSTLTFTSPHTLLWIHASLQAVNDPYAASQWWRVLTSGFWGGNRKADTFANLLVGIAVDGYVIPESVVGGVESDNDRNYGVRLPSMPLATSLVYPVVAGEHTIEIQVRVGPKQGTLMHGPASEPVEKQDDNTQGWDGKGVRFEQRELIVLEMRR